MIADKKEARAFRLAQQLAAENWLQTGAFGDSEITDENIGKVAAAGGSRPDVDVQRWVETHVEDSKLRIALSDAVGHLTSDAQAAGYLYGLALGLVLGRGGSR